MNKGLNIPEYVVSQFNRLFKEVIEKNFDYVRIRGEISELKNAASGHLYLTLKDKDSVLATRVFQAVVGGLRRVVRFADHHHV